MISVAEYLKKLLYEQDCVVVPELGGFLSHFNHAYFSGINGLYYAPAKRIAFNEALKLDDGLLVHYISVNEQIKREEAQMRVRQFADEIKSEINKIGFFQIPNLGILTSNQEGKFLFEPQTGKNYYQEGYGLKTLSVNTVTPQVSVPEKQFEIESTDRAAIEQPLNTIRRRSRVALYASSILLAGGLFYATSDTPLSGSFRSSLNPFDLFFNNLDEQKTKEVKISAAQQPVYQAPAKVEPTVSVAQPELVETKTSVVIENSTSIAKETINEKPPIEIPKTIQIATAQTEKKAIESDENAQYFVIAGAFLKEDNAINLVSKLKKSGYPNASMMAIDDRNLFKVSAVGLSSEARAVGQMAKINKLSKAQSWVLHVD